MDNSVNLEQKLLKQGRILALKIFAEAYLLKQGNTITDELFQERNVDENTELKGGEVFVLHHWLIDEYREMGLDLNKIIEANGEVVQENKLSNYELAMLIKKADTLITQISVIKKYYDAKH